MNSNEFFKEVLNILENLDSQTRINFIKELSKNLNYRECKTVHNIISDRKRKICQNGIKGILPSIPHSTKVFSIDIEKIQFLKVVLKSQHPLVLSTKILRKYILP
jgi:hypothetical protein